MEKLRNALRRHSVAQQWQELRKGGISMEVKPTCKGCKDRKVTEDYNFHTVCERYRAYKAYLKAVMAELSERYSIRP